MHQHIAPCSLDTRKCLTQNSTPCDVTTHVWVLLDTLEIKAKLLSGNVEFIGESHLKQKPLSPEKQDGLEIESENGIAGVL